MDLIAPLMAVAELGSFSKAAARLGVRIERTTPGGLEPWYREVASIVPASGEVEVARVLEASRRYGLEFDMESLVDIMSRHSVHLA